MLWAGVVNEASALTETQPISLPPGLGSQYCYQADLRMSYTDSRPGYPSFSGRLNLITKKVADPATPWLPNNDGPVGLADAISMLRNPNLSFLPYPITLDLPVNSRGTIRIVGTLVRPMGDDQICIKSNFGVPVQNFAVWGEAQLQPGGPQTLTIPVNVISTTPLSGGTSDPYTTPSPSGNQFSNPSGPLGIKCRDVSNASTCMNRNLLEFKLKPGIAISQPGTPNYEDFTIESHGVHPWDMIETKLKGISGSNHFHFYLSKRRVFKMFYISYLSAGSITQVDVDIEVDLASMKYSYHVLDNVSELEKRDIKDCGGGKFGILIPSTSIYLPLPPLSNCNLGQPNGPNVIISDLGYGF